MQLPASRPLLQCRTGCPCPITTRPDLLLPVCCHQAAHATWGLPPAWLLTSPCAVPAGMAMAGFGAGMPAFPAPFQQPPPQSPLLGPQQPQASGQPQQEGAGTPRGAAQPQSSFSGGQPSGGAGRFPRGPLLHQQPHQQQRQQQLPPSSAG